ncbi:MAG: hypothetical protein ACKVU1_06610 [bacterium]
MKKVTSARKALVGLLTLGLAVASFASHAKAGSLMSEDFSYSDGGLVAVSGGNWTNHSGTGTDVQVLSSAASGLMSNSPDDNRLLTSARSSTDKTYACFKLVIPAPSATLVCNYFAHFMVSSTTFRSKVFITPSGGSFTMGLSVTANASGTPLAPPAPPLGATWPTTLNYGQAYNIVISYNAVGGISEMWVDPINESSPSISATDAGAANGALTAFGLRQSSTGGAAFAFIVDDLSVGTTFEDACGAPPPVTEACCFVDGTCSDLTVDECALAGGTSQGAGSDCATTTCTDFTGACCYLDGTCADDLLEADCVANGGAFQGGGSDCASANCPNFYGACCFNDGSCADGALEADCVAAGGSFQGGGTDCGSANCVNLHGACCLPNGQCIDSTLEANCVGAGGTFQGNGSLCGSVNCPQPTEACCYTDGFCADMLPADCVATGGVPQGQDTNCANTFCPPPPPVGACCLADGSCFDGIYESDCSAQNGVFNQGLLCQEVNCVNATEPKTWGGIKGQYR